MAKTKKFYFTYSNSGEHPFDSGFTVVYAEDFGEATEKFCKRHPPRFPGLMCCAAMYSDEAFRKTDMYLGDNKNGESKLAGKAAFNTDFNFNIAEYFHFCNRLLKPEPKKGGERGRSSDAPCMIVFCSFEQIPVVKQYAAKHGFIHSIPLVFIKHHSPQALKANMRIVGATEYALVLYRSYLPKFRNKHYTDADGVDHGTMVFNWFEWKKDGKDIPKLHPTQKPVALLKELIEIFTDPGDVVIDPVAGSGSTLRAARELGRPSYGFEVGKAQYQKTIEGGMLTFSEV